jgi:hypothetical protein
LQKYCDVEERHRQEERSSSRRIGGPEISRDDLAHVGKTDAHALKTSILPPSESAQEYPLFSNGVHLTNRGSFVSRKAHQKTEKPKFFQESIKRKTAHKIIPME